MTTSERVTDLGTLAVKTSRHLADDRSGREAQAFSAATDGSRSQLAEALGAASAAWQILAERDVKSEAAAPSKGKGKCEQDGAAAASFHFQNLHDSCHACSDASSAQVVIVFNDVQLPHKHAKEQTARCQRWLDDNLANFSRAFSEDPITALRFQTESPPFSMLKPSRPRAEIG